MRTLMITLVSMSLLAFTGGPAQAGVPQPDLSTFTEVDASGFPSDVDGSVYFSTPDGLSCGIRPNSDVAGCDGTLPGTPAAANEIVLSTTLTQRGFQQTANLQFRPTSGVAPQLAPGTKIVVGDVECAVGTGATTMCAVGLPATQWFVLTPTGSGLGPRTEGIPDDVPDPIDFVVDDQSYLVGTGPKNLFPIFTVPAGLTCSIIMYSGGEIGCDGTLPSTQTPGNEIFTTIPGVGGIRETNTPKYNRPAYPGQIKRLPAGYRVNGVGGQCMSTSDGVACMGAVGDQPQGFVVAPSGTRTWP